MRFEIQPEKCVACLACVRICPADAVAVEGTAVRIVDAACTRCGLCLPACPHDAIVAQGDFDRALLVAAEGTGALILSVEASAYFHPVTPEQVVNACYAAGFRTVHRGVLGDELVAQAYLEIWADKGWGTVIRSTCPVIVETIRREYPELLPYVAPVATPVASEARYLRSRFGPGVPIVYAGVCVTEGGPDVSAVLTLEELSALLEMRGVRLADQPTYFTRIPEERRRHVSTAGGLPLPMLMEERHASRRFRKFRGLSQLEQIAQAVTVERMDLGFVDILPCEGCLDHPLLGPREELFKRRRIVDATEPPRSRLPVLDPTVVVDVGAAYEPYHNGQRPPEEQIAQVIELIGRAPNGRPWDCGACGYPTCRQFAVAMLDGRTTLRQCPPYQERRAEEAQRRAAVDELTGLATFRVLRERLASEMARSRRSEEPFAILFADLDKFKQVNDRYGHQAGNVVLKETGLAVQHVVRTTDLAARYGGDEFVVVLVRTHLDGARRVGEAVREAVEAVGGRLGYPEGTVVVSVGVAEWNAKQQAPEDLLVAADRALYRAKESGGNIVASETGDPPT